jgi:glycosyltransferase involved in cell wall biosynthesis
MTKADIVHAFGMVSPISVLPAIIAKITQTAGLGNHRLVIDWDDWWGRGGILAGFNILVRSSMTFFEEGMPRLGNSVTVASDALLRRALRGGIKSQSIMKLPNGADVESIHPLSKDSSRVRLGLPLDKTIVCHLGFTRLTSLIDELERIHHRNEFLFVVVGHLPRYEKVEKDLFRRKNVIFVGRQPPVLIPFYLASADILLLNQDPGPSDEARWPIRFGDYLAAGRAIITQKIGEISRVIESSRCGLLTRPGDWTDLAAKLVDVASDRSLCEVMGRKAREVAETQLSWEHLAARLELFYKDTLEIS